MNQPISRKTPFTAASARRHRSPHVMTVAFVVAAIMVAAIRMAHSAILPDFESLVDENRPAVVNISTTGQTTSSSAPALKNVPEALENVPEMLRRFFEEYGIPRSPIPRPESALGSGFIIRPDGYVLTNAHVVQNAAAIRVGLNDRREFPATLVGTDPRTDIALLKVDATDLPAVRIGDSDRLKVGQWVLAIGRPFGFENTATQGIVSGLARSLPDDSYVPFIQTDVAVNPGNSGGPLFDLEGRVVGINSQIYSQTGGYMGVSFAIPINLAMQVADQLRENGRVSRGYLGVSIQDMDQELADAFGLDRPRGALVTAVTPDGPADRAGIEAGDVILEFDGRSILASGSLPPMVGALPAGRKVEVVVLRGGSQEKLTANLGELEQPQPVASASHPSAGGRLGMAVEARGDEGVVVTGVEPGSAAELAGIRPSDRLLSFDRQKVESPKQLRELVRKAPAGKPIAILVKRGDQTQFKTITLPEATS